MSLDGVLTSKHSSILIKDAPMVIIRFSEHSERGPEVWVMDLGDEKTRAGDITVCNINLKEYPDKDTASRVIRNMYLELDGSCDAEGYIEHWSSVLQIMRDI
jgi:hypothetical protein